MSNCPFFDDCNHIDCNKEMCLKRVKLEDLYSKTLLSKNQMKKQILCVDQDGTDMKEFTELSNIEKNIVNFVQNGQNLYLHSSNCGNGKSSWSIRFIQAYLAKIWPMSHFECKAMFISVPRFLLATKDFDNKNNTYLDFIKENIFKADLVVFDDIAAKIGTEWELSQLLSIIDNRIILGKSNIFTSNLNTKEMTEALGERLASRICRYSREIELHGADKRGLVVE